MNRRRSLPCSLLFLLASCTGAGVAPAVGAEPPSVDARPHLVGHGPVDDRLGEVPSADGRFVAGVIADEPASSTIVAIAGGADPATRTVVVPDRVLDLVFSPDGGTLFVLQHRPARKREGEAFLLPIALDDLKPARSVRLPPSARALGYWPREHTLLVACRDEIRALTLPDLRSGATYRVLGVNAALYWLDGTRVLVGQDDRLLVVDLADRPPDGHELVPREMKRVGAPVLRLFTSSAGEPVARLGDETFLGVTAEPLSVHAVPAAAAAPRPPVDREQVESPTPIERSPPAGTATALLPVAHLPEPRAEVRPQAEVEPRAEARPPPDGEVVGHIRGIGDRTVSVVLHGPDSLIREATRVRPEPDGSFTARGLAPGRYRLVLDAGGSVVPVTRPPFVIVEVGTGGSRAEDIEVVRYLEP